MSQPVEYAALVLLDGDFAAQHWVLDQDSMVLGRDDSCEIVIPHRQISRQHIRFERQNDDRYTVEDLASKNGTWINGNRLEGRIYLGDGDEIYLSLKLRLRFVGSGVTAPVTQDLPRIIGETHHQERLRIDADSRRVFLQGVELDPPLSLPQYRLLELLYANPDRVCTREEVVQAVWPEAVSDGISEQAIDALVRRLRDRMDEIDDRHQYIVTIRGHGFRIDNPN